MNTILVGLDFSPASRHVLTAAKDLATRTGARLVLSHAVGIPVELPPEAYVMSPENVVDLLVKNARKDLDKLAGELPPDMVQDVVVEVGTPWRAICDLAERRKVDLIVIGAHGHRLLDRVLGTTTGRVVSHTDRSVLVVRSPAMFAEATRG